MAHAFCGDSYQCQYDYSVSLNRDLAFYTLQYLTSFTSIRAKTKDRGKADSNRINQCHHKKFSFEFLYCYAF